MNSTQHEKELDEVLKERDSYHDVADRLADCIERITGIDNGEHSSCNCPWQNAEENAGFYVDERDALRDQNAALAAHVERFREVLEEAADKIGTCICGDSTYDHHSRSDHDLLDVGWKLLDDFLGEAPAASIARLNARVATTTLERLAERYDGCFILSHELDEAIEEYRQQAEGDV